MAQAQSYAPPAYSGPYQPSYPQLQPQAPYYPPVFMVQPQQQQQQQQQQMTNVNVNVTGGAPSTQQVIIVKRGVNHCLHCCITFFFFPWVFVWIFLCITEGN